MSGTNQTLVMKNVYAPKPKALFHYLALKANAMRNCEKHEIEWRQHREAKQNAGAPYREYMQKEEHYEQMAYEHRHRIEQACKNRLPSGSGFDNGTQFDFDKSTDDKLIFITEFHHMNGNGFYCGWSHHTVVVTPCFGGINIKVTGKNYKDIKEYISDTFHNCLTDMVDENGDIV